MPRIVSLLTLILAAVWLAVGASNDFSELTAVKSSDVENVGEHASRIKSAKASTSVGVTLRAPQPVSADFDPRSQASRACLAPEARSRCAIFAARPLPVLIMPAAPSLTGQVVLVV